ncbi:universal stress protein [Solibacillus sp. CAU 1738]|uniref:universal stress protein n=1 Tax=Solibacillus sp. CAU 1738 TaxID=3140363 RepID=UPI003261535A
MNTQYSNIAVAVDFSQQSLVAFERAVALAKQHSAGLHLISVVDTRSFGSIEAYDLKYAERVKKERQEMIEQLKVKALDAGVAHVHTKVELGSPKVILLEQQNINLIVIGATGLNRVEKMVLGSVSGQIVRHAKCDVLVVRSS